MIYIRLEGHAFKYEVLDIIKLFCDEDTVLFIDTEPPENYRRIFILSRIFEQDGLYVLNTNVECDSFRWVSNIELNIPVEKVKENESKKRFKREVKTQIFLGMKKLIGKRPPWGILTGIRPAKIVHDMLDSGMNMDTIITNLHRDYHVSEQKAHLLHNVASVERIVLEQTKSDMVSMYIGIPFCNTRCLYCSFTSNSTSKYSHIIGSYMEALKQEISEVNKIIKENGYSVQSIYIGGGTPTSIDAANLQELLCFIEKNLDLRNLQEYTVEAGRPDTISLEKLQIMRNSQVSRISINPQSMNEKTLKLIGRGHSVEEVVSAFHLARKTGFDNINMDIIIGLPGEDILDLKNTLCEIEKLLPESLTVHTMAVKRASRFSTEREKYRLITAEETMEMINLAQQYAQNMNMHPYYLYRQKNILGNLENIGYSKPGMEGIYNIQIMEEKQSIIAFGAGAITKVVYPEENRIERAFNVKSVEEYISRINEMIERKRELLCSFGK